MSAKKKPTMGSLQREIQKAQKEVREMAAGLFEYAVLERMCVHCGCTDSKACLGGCFWAVEHRATNTGVCSRCVPKEIKLVDSL